MLCAGTPYGRRKHMDTKYRPLSFIAAAIVVFGIASGASADQIIYQQPVHSSVVGSLNSINAQAWSPIDIGTAGSIKGVSLWVQASTTADFIVAVDCFTDHTHAIMCPGWSPASPTGAGLVFSGTVTAAAGGGQVDFNTALASTTGPVSVGNNLFIALWPTTQTSRVVFGTSTPNQCDTSCYPGSPFLYLRAADQDDPGAFTTSYIQSQTSPTQSEVTGSTDVDFAYSFWNTGYEGFDKAGVALNNLSSGQNVTVSEQAISSTGAGSYSNTVTLISGDAYSYRPYLRNSSTNVKAYGQTFVFYVVSNSGGQSYVNGVPIFQDVNDANATSTLFGASAAFNLVDVILGKFPINWVIEMGQVITDLQTQTSTTSLPSMSVNFGELRTLQAIATTSPQNWTVNFLSADMFQQISDIPAMQTARQVCSGILWFGLVMLGWRESRRLFAAGNT